MVFLLGITIPPVIFPSYLFCRSGLFFEDNCIVNAIFRRNNESHAYSTWQVLHLHLPLTRTSFAQKSLYEGLGYGINLHNFYESPLIFTLLKD